VPSLPRLPVAVGGLLALGGCVLGAVTAGNPWQHPGPLVAWQLACFVAFAVAAWAVRGVEVRRAVPLIVAGAIGLQVVAMASLPQTTDDYYRYAWDGRVQAAGVDPYRYAPVDPALAGLRTDWLFPAECRSEVPVCTRMNHPTAPTIYPPVAQAWFTVVHLVTRPLGPDGGHDRTWQAAAALLALAVLAALLLVLRRSGGDPRQAVLWGWCPAVVLEAGGAAHVDVLAALFAVLCLAAAAARRRGWAGAALGAAVSAKLLPVLLVPALVAPLPGLRAGAAAWLSWARRRLPLVLVAAAVVVLGYVPHVVAVGSRAAGFLPGFLSEEGYDDGGKRFGLLRPWLPDRVALVVAVVLVAGIAVLVARRTDPARPAGGSVVLVGVAFAVAGIEHPWYGVLLVAAVALAGRGVWLAVVAASYPVYASPAGGGSLVAQWVGYGGALLLVAGWELRRRRRAAAPDGAADEVRHTVEA
jgi:hypothetical protein